MNVLRRSFLPRLWLLALLAVGLSGCKSELYSNLSEREVNEMIAVLSAAGIETSREKAKGGTFSILVGQDDTATAIALLNQSGLPRQQFDSLANIFDAKKMVSTPFEERARFMHAMNQELAQSLTQIAGVVSAQVHLMLPDASPLDRVKQPARASVFVYHQPTVDVAQHIPVIKNLIVNAVNGLNYEDVAVAAFPINPPGSSTSASAALRFDNTLILMLLAAFLVGMVLFRQKIVRAVERRFREP